jgi:hypothetical protein
VVFRTVFIAGFLAWLTACGGPKPLVGRWESKRVSEAETPVVTTLILNADGKAEITSASDGTAAVSMTGTWKPSGENGVSTLFTHRSEHPLPEPQTIEFRLHEGKLLYEKPFAGPAFVRK